MKERKKRVNIFGEKKENVIEMSNNLINRYGLANLSKCSLTELQQIEGIGLAKASQLLALFEFSKRHNLAGNPNKKITCAKDVFDLFFIFFSVSSFTQTQSPILHNLNFIFHRFFNFIF